MQIACLHTAEVHVATFDRLLDDLGYTGERTHRVMPELLARAQADGLESVEAEVVDQLSELASADAVMCSCSTLGPVADQVAVSMDNVFRIDRPLMEDACGFGQNVLVALCLESTRSGTVALLEKCAAEAGRPLAQRVLVCAGAWRFFEQGEMDGFAAEIAQQIEADLAEHGKPDCIVLAQASMRVAEPLLLQIGVPVLSSPLLAARRAVEIAQGRTTTPA